MPSEYSWASNPWVWCLTFRRVDEPPSGKPILFKGEMVRAILAGRKSQTRRVIVPQPGWLKRAELWSKKWISPGRDDWRICPYGTPGDRLWVRETWAIHGGYVVYRADLDDWSHINPLRWSPSIHMHQTSSRITLELTDVRVQRVQEISEEDAAAEGLHVQMGSGTGPGAGYKWNGPGYTGIDRKPSPTFHVAASAHGECSCFARPRTAPATCAFRELWDGINGKRQPKQRRERTGSLVSRTIP